MKISKINHRPWNGRLVDPSKDPRVMSLDQVTWGQETFGLYSTLLEDIFLNEKHAVF